MSRIDLVRLRKRARMSQKELADLLQVRPSFLSAIENGKSRLPDEKLERIKEIFELDSLDAYVIDDTSEASFHYHVNAPDQSDTVTMLLNQLHDLAHQRHKANGMSETDMDSHIDFLTRRNDRLSERVDDLRDEVDSLRKENLRLKELLVKNGIAL